MHGGAGGDCGGVLRPPHSTTKDTVKGKRNENTFLSGVIGRCHTQIIKIDAYRRCNRRLIRAQEFETERIIINSYLYIDFVQMSLFYVNFRFAGTFKAPVIRGKPNIFFVVDIIVYLTPRAPTCIYNLGCNVAAIRDIAAYIRAVVTHFVKWEENLNFDAFVCL